MRRFHRARDKEAVIEGLIGNGRGAFTQIWQVLVFAACLGWKERKREPLGDSDASVAVPPSVFANNCPSWPGLIYLISIVQSEEPSVLSSDDDADEARIRLLEEYANGGLAYLAERLEPSSYSVGSVAAFLIEHMLTLDGGRDTI